MRKILSSTLMMFLFSLSAHAWAANYSDPIDGVFRGIYGDTISVEVPSLVSKSPVTIEDQNGDLSFQFNGSTAYSNFNQLTDLRNGDPVRVQYTQDFTAKDKQMIATIITKLEPAVVVNPVITTNSTDVAPVPTATQTITTTTTTRINSQ